MDVYGQSSGEATPAKRPTVAAVVFVAGVFAFIVLFTLAAFGVLADSVPAVGWLPQTVFAKVVGVVATVDVARNLAVVVRYRRHPTSPVSAPWSMLDWLSVALFVAIPVFWLVALVRWEGVFFLEAVATTAVTLAMVVTASIRIESDDTARGETPDPAGPQDAQTESAAEAAALWAAVAKFEVARDLGTRQQNASARELCRLYRPVNILDTKTLWALSLAGSPDQLIAVQMGGPEGPVLSPRMTFRINRVLTEIQALIEYFHATYSDMLSMEGNVDKVVALDKEAVALRAAGLPLDDFSIGDCEKRLNELLPFFISMHLHVANSDDLKSEAQSAVHFLRERLVAGRPTATMMFDRVLLWAALNEVSRRAMSADPGEELFIGESAFAAVDGLDTQGEVDSVRLALCGEDLGPLFVMSALEIMEFVNDCEHENRSTGGLVPARTHWAWPLWFVSFDLLDDAVLDDDE